MKIGSSRTSVKYLCYILFGIISTMPILSIYVAGKTISVFMLMIPVILLFLITGKKRASFRLSSKEWMFIVFFLISIGSLFVGAIYFRNNLQYPGLPVFTLVKILSFLLISVLLFLAEDAHNIAKKILKGLYIGSILNLAWATADGLIYYISGISIHNVVFQQYIINNDIRLGMLSIILGNGSIRTAGFNYDPAHIGFLAPLMFGYAFLRGNVCLLLLTIGALLMSQSTTGLVTCVLIMLVFLLTNKKRNFFRRIVALGSIAFLLLIIAMQVDTISAYILPFMERILSKFSSGDGAETARIIYNFHFLEAAIYSPVSVIFGTGFGTASYPFTAANLIPDKFFFDPENTYVSYLFDTGIVGVVIYVVVLFYIIRMAFKKINQGDSLAIMYYQIIVAGGLALLFSGLFYHYILYTPQVLLIITGIAILRREQQMVYSKERVRQGAFTDEK